MSLKSVRERTTALMSFATAKSFADYVGCHYFLEELVIPYGEMYGRFMYMCGLPAAAIYGIKRKSFKEFVGSIPLFGLANFFAENMFYIWVDLLGDRNGCYEWYTGNFLNPDGQFGYSWTNPGEIPFTNIDGGMLGYALQIFLFYGAIYMVSHGIEKYGPDMVSWVRKSIQ